MSTKVDYIPMAGGLDNTHSHIITKPGRLTACVNYEEVFGLQGYRRIYGYERYDGLPEPSKVEYATINFINGDNEPAVGDYVYAFTGVAAFYIGSITLTSGSWAGNDAAGVAMVYGFTGALVGGESIRHGGPVVFEVDGPAIEGSRLDADYDVKHAAIIESARSAIEAVPGSGPILGIAVFKGAVYAARNAADGLTAAIYSSYMIGGWTPVKQGLVPDGKYRFDVANFSGASNTLSLYGCDGKNNPFWIDGAGYHKITGIWSTNATSTTSNNIATGVSQTYVVVEDDRSFEVLSEVVIRDGSNAANRMTMVISSWTPGTKTLIGTVYEAQGSGTGITNWDISLPPYDDRGIYPDKPYLIKAHKDHLFLAYPFAQLQASNLGDPTTYTTTASLFGTGDEITDVLPLKSDNMAIYCENTIYVLSGSSQIDWKLDPFSVNSGAITATASEVAGSGMHLDYSGVKSLQASQNYGDYGVSTLSIGVSDTVKAMIPSIVGVQGRKGAQQYRLYAAYPDASTPFTRVLSFTVTTPSAEIMPKDVSPTIQEYPLVITCLGSGELLGGEEAHFFGTDDGFVMREHVGKSFDGGSIYSSMKLPYNSFKSPSQKKRFRKLIMEIVGTQEMGIAFKQSFDDLDGRYPSSENISINKTPSHGLWDEDEWDTFTWTNPTQQVQSEVNVAGIGRSMSLLLWGASPDLDPYTIQGIIVHYSHLGMQR